MLTAPWDIHHDLTQDRLARVADVLRRGRDSAARNAKWNLGDTLWSVGCVAYERGKHGLFEAAKAEYADWLSLEEVDHHLLVKIKLVPLRFYRGSEDRPVPHNYAEASPGERAALQLAFEADGMFPLGGHMRLEIETTTKGFAKAIRFVQLDAAGERQNPWPIPKLEVPRKAGKLLPGPIVSSAIEAQDTGT